MGANDKQVGGSHYKDLEVQPWDALKAWLTPEEFRGYMKGTVISYLARENQKGGDMDIRKSCHTLEKLVEVLGDNRPIGNDVQAFLDKYSGEANGATIS